MKYFNMLSEPYRKAAWKVARFLYRTEVHVYPKSAYFSAHTEVIVVLFGKLVLESEIYRTPMDANGHIDVQYLFDNEPRMHKLQVHYPDDWDDQLVTFRENQEKDNGTFEEGT